MTKFFASVQTIYAGLTGLAKILILVVVLGLGVFAYRAGCGTPAAVVVQQDKHTTNVTLPSNDITPKEVIKFVQDDAEVKKLLAENAKLKRQVTQLSETIATFKATGSGTVQIVERTLPGETIVVDSAADAFVIRPGKMITFSDFRLVFNTDGRRAEYTLSQKFEVLQAAGLNKDGTKFNTVKLFEIGPNETRTPITDFTTTNVFTNDAKAKWHLGFTLQAGGGYFAESSDVAKKAAGGLVGFQWLKKGVGEAAENSSLSLFSPFAILGEDIQFGIAPVSFNLGKVKYQPFKDLWVSPVIGWDTTKGSVGKVGVGVTASF